MNRRKFFQGICIAAVSAPLLARSAIGRVTPPDPSFDGPFRVLCSIYKESGKYLDPNVEIQSDYVTSFRENVQRVTNNHSVPQKVQVFESKPPWE